MVLNIHPVNAQDLINPYKDMNGLIIGNVTYNTDFGNNYYYPKIDQAKHPYSGEFQILLDDFLWGNESLYTTNIIADNSNYGLSYQIEAVSFPFSIECTFSPSGDCADGTSTRILTMPNPANANFYSTSTNWWEYQNYGHAFKLLTKSGITPFNVYSLNSTYSSMVGVISQRSDLVSAGFKTSSGGDQLNNIFPHTILKITINIHCGSDIYNNPILNSFSFLVDPTRGKMREYPFLAINQDNTQPYYYDLLIRPQAMNSFFNYSRSSNCSEYCITTTNVNDVCESVPYYKGGTIDYTPFGTSEDIQDNLCATLLNSSYSNYSVSSVSDDFINPTGKIQRIPLPPYSIIQSTFIRDFQGKYYAGYTENNSAYVDIVPNSPAIHAYKIDQNILLENINSNEKIIYNPSEVEITATDLHFPSNYTFKTIRGKYPYYQDVVAANSTANGGPYSDLKDVPVETDLLMDYHIDQNTYQNDDTDHKLASIYHLESGSKLTIEPCVKLFDCTFEINPGSEIVFENTPTNINKQRYQLLYNGGTVTERDEQWLFQNKTETRSILNYDAADFILAGRNVDSNQPQGDYIVNAGADVTFAASNRVVLKDGFRANSGSKFHAYISPITVPGCPQRMARPDHNSSQTENVTGKNNNQFFLAPSLTTSRSYLNFKIQREGYYSIEVINSLGETQMIFFDNRFFRADTYKLDEDFTDLAPGVYICKLSGGEEQYTAKFIKSN